MLFRLWMILFLRLMSPLVVGVILLGCLISRPVLFLPLMTTWFLLWPSCVLIPWFPRWISGVILVVFRRVRTLLLMILLTLQFRNVLGILTLWMLLFLSAVRFLMFLSLMDLLAILLPRCVFSLKLVVLLLPLLI